VKSEMQQDALKASSFFSIYFQYIKDLFSGIQQALLFTAS
jgi:hypothetical protein